MLACVVGWVLRPAASLAAHQQLLLFAQDARASTAAAISSDGTIRRYGWVVCTSAAALTTLEVKTKGVGFFMFPNRYVTTTASWSEVIGVLPSTVTVSSALHTCCMDLMHGALFP